MTGRGIGQIFPHPSDPVLYERFVKDSRYYLEITEKRSGPIPKPAPFDYIWGEALSEFEHFSPDVRIINLETAVTTSDDHWPRKGIHYRMHPKNFQVLTAAGIDVCSIANNHILDWGYKGLDESLEVLRENHLSICGAGNNSADASAPAVIQAGNQRILVFAYTCADAGTPYAWRAKIEKPGVNLLTGTGRRGVKQVIQDTEKFKKVGDIIILSIHWGDNWGYEIPQSHRKLAHRLIDNESADLIFGHSSHHPKAMEIYKDRLILYGCGDLLNDYEAIPGHEEYRPNLSCMYFPVIKPSGALKTLQISPMKIHRFRLHRANENERNWLSKRLGRECRKLGTGIELTENGRMRLTWN